MQKYDANDTEIEALRLSEGSGPGVNPYLTGAVEQEDYSEDN